MTIQRTNVANYRCSECNKPVIAVNTSRGHCLKCPVHDILGFANHFNLQEAIEYALKIGTIYLKGGK